MKENCIFCKIANGEISSHTLYEDEDFKVIFDLGPATRGHAIIIAKEHAENIYELDEKVASKVFVLAKKMATVMTEAFKCDGFNIVQNNGKCAGQSVFHFHMHLIPRYVDDHAIEFWKAGETTEDKLIELENKVKEVLGK
jgi:histidine triad (HIT) family protein